MSVLSAYFDESVNQCSPVQKDYVRVVNYDEDGHEIITFEEVDYPTLQKSFGLVSDWSLDSLIKAGIDPKFAIHTGMPTRLEGVPVVSRATAYVDSLLESDSKTE